MNRKRVLLLLSLAVAGLITSAFLSTISLPGFAQTAIPNSSIEMQIKGNGKTEMQGSTDAEMEGRELYKIGKIEEAISLWQQTLDLVRDRGDKLSQARILSNLGLAYQQLGQWNEARSTIAESLNLIESIPVDRQTSDRTRALAQVLNNQGILQLALGQPQPALLSWQRAEQAYTQIKDETGVLRSQINQANAWHSLGMYHRALQVFETIKPSLEKPEHTDLQVAGWRTLGRILTLVGELSTAQEALDRSLQLATELSLVPEKAEILLELGNLAIVKGNSQAALDYYQQGLNLCQNLPGSDRLLNRLLLAKLNLNLELDRTEEAISVWREIAAKQTQNSFDRAGIYNNIYLARNLITLQQKSETQAKFREQIPDWQAIAALVSHSIQQAQIIEDKKAEAYAKGILGEVYEHQQQWTKAQELTEQAIFLTQNLDAPEITYLWQWQLGRIQQAQAESKQAIIAYSEAVNLLKSLSKDLVAIDPNVQFSFKESVEPVYRELVSLLLQGEVSQENLAKARDTIESLQVAELNNFLREACTNVRTIKIDQVDKQAAVIYPIILGDRLEVILSLPNQPLRHYATKIKAAELEKTIAQFRQSAVIRSQRFFYQPAEKLYNLLISPVLGDLQKNQIKTLAFVLDGSLRNIPMASLYDGKQYLIEQYSIALTPGLQLLSPRSLQDLKLKILATGITQAKDEFPALNDVANELKAIKSQLPTTILLDRDFTSEKFAEKIEFTNFPIVHIATHGQFSSTLADTFLLAWDRRINLDRLDRILTTRVDLQNRAIELLVLSACQTASGDKQAALGLAGVAIKAGARSTVASLWSVNDRATAELMNRFYQAIATKQTTKAEALRQAQLSLLKDPWYQHPFYWSSFVLVGNWL
jgi:CHAT domain-containing protein